MMWRGGNRGIGERQRILPLRCVLHTYQISFRTCTIANSPVPLVVHRRLRRARIPFQFLHSHRTTVELFLPPSSPPPSSSSSSNPRSSAFHSNLSYHAIPFLPFTLRRPNHFPYPTGAGDGARDVRNQFWTSGPPPPPPPPSF